MSDPTGPFRRSDRVLKSREFSRVGRDGLRVVDPAFVLVVSSRIADACETPRLGITVSRKVGGAVVRNRVKRRVREWFRQSRAKLRGGIDLVVIGRSDAVGLSGRDTREILCRLAHKANATQT